MASPDGGVESVPVEVALAFHPRTLGQLLYVRTSLRLDDRTDRFLAAALTGILHGKSASYLSELMPNTFSMAPRYVREFAARTAFASPERDVFDGLAKKLDRLFRQPPPSIEGIALLGDARDVAPRARAALRARGRPDRARLVVTSPPYLRVVKYGYYNWLRTWFLGFDARAIDATLDDAHHREPYLLFLRDVLAGLRPVLADDAVVVLVIGDVETDRGRTIKGGVGLAERAWVAAAEPEGYRLAGVALDDVAAVRKMTKLWGDEAGRATKTDRILVLGATEAGRRRALAGAPLDVDWTWPPRALRSL
jgi:site-specific DNA-methyltransferase (adenine-specific)